MDLIENQRIFLAKASMFEPLEGRFTKEAFEINKHNSVNGVSVDQLMERDYKKLRSSVCIFCSTLDSDANLWNGTVGVKNVVRIEYDPKYLITELNKFSFLNCCVFVHKDIT